MPIVTDALQDLKQTLEGLITHLFPGKEYRWLDDCFLITEPSVQIEVQDNGLLWSADDRFIQQFKDGLTTFQLYSKYPAVIRDISFWIQDYAEYAESLWARYNDLRELCRNIGQKFNRRKLEPKLVRSLG